MSLILPMVNSCRVFKKGRFVAKGKRDTNVSWCDSSGPGRPGRQPQRREGFRHRSRPSRNSTADHHAVMTTARVITPRSLQSTTAWATR